MAESGRNNLDLCDVFCTKVLMFMSGLLIMIVVWLLEWCTHVVINYVIIGHVGRVSYDELPISCL